MAHRNVLLASAAALALSTLATSALAAGSLSASAIASVTVVSPTTFTKIQDMAFGTVIRPSGANGNTTFKLDTGDVVTATGGDGSVVASTTSSAKFSLNTIAAITYTTNQTLTFLPAGNLINVSATLPTITSGPATPGALAANGVQTLAYGGQFDVAPTTTPQTYTGTLAVTVNYN
jgi:hypothetical protein